MQKIPNRIGLKPGLNLLSQPSPPVYSPFLFCLVEAVDLRGRPAGKRRIVVSSFLLALSTPLSVEKRAIAVT